MQQPRSLPACTHIICTPLDVLPTEQQLASQHSQVQNVVALTQRLLQRKNDKRLAVLLAAGQWQWHCVGHRGPRGHQLPRLAGNKHASLPGAGAWSNGNRPGGMWPFSSTAC
jgi:hypothetical protein